MAKRKQEISYVLEKNVPIKELGKDLRKLWDEQSEYYRQLSTLEVNKAFTFNMSDYKIVRAIQTHLSHRTPMRFFFRLVTNHPPTGRLFRAIDNTKFKTHNRNKPNYGN